MLYECFHVFILFNRTLVEACNEGDIGKVQKLLNEGRVSVHDTTEEGESLLSLACSAGYFELAQVNTEICRALDNCNLGADRDSRALT